MAALAQIAELRSLTLDCDVTRGFAELACLPLLTKLVILKGWGPLAPGIDSTIGGLTTLQHLHLQYGGTETNLERFTPLTRLQCLVLEQANYGSLRDYTMWAPLARLPHLTELRVLQRPWRKVPPLPGDLISKLARLVLRGTCHHAGLVRSITKLAALDLCVFDVNPPSKLAYAPNLTELALRFAPGKSAIWPDRRGLVHILHLQKLQKLTLSSAFMLDLRDLDGLPALVELELRYCQQLRTLDGIVAGVPLRMLDVHQCGFLRDIGAIAHASALKSLSIRGCPGLFSEGAATRSIAAINLLTGLQTLRLDGRLDRPELGALRHLAFAEPHARGEAAIPICEAPEWDSNCSICGAAVGPDDDHFASCGDALCTHVMCTRCQQRCDDGNHQHSYDPLFGEQPEDKAPST